MTRIALYDTTLRDGAQSEDVAFTLEDKLRVAEHLDACGIGYIEGGWPGSNPRDEEFFAAVRRLDLKHARVAAFGSTRRANVAAADDLNLRMLLKAETPVVTIVGKTWDLHVRDDLRISHEQNLDVIRDSVAYLKQRVDEVIFDAEHFFDGFRADPAYALACLKAAAEGGADVLVLCDTRGGSMPQRIAAGVAAALEIGARLGIHCHNDCELAVANTLAAVAAGATQVQGTINGFGERCGNANLCSVIPNLQLKLGYECVSPEQLKRLSELSRVVYELANIEPYKRQAYVGESAFAHKGGLHVAAVQKNRETYEHIDPELVGNRQRVLVSDLSGRSSVIYKAKQFGFDVDYSNPAVKAVLEKVKQLESAGFQYEGAEASFELLMQEALQGSKVQHFRLVAFRVSDEKNKPEEPPLSEATVMVELPDGHVEHTVAVGNGPLNALDRALRKALKPFYPELEAIELLDYKVRVLGGGHGTEATVRVLIESGDGETKWGTVGVSSNVIEASWQALVDSIEYKLYKSEQRRAAAARRSG